MRNSFMHVFSSFLSGSSSFLHCGALMHVMLCVDRKPGVEPFEEAVNRANHMGWTDVDPALSWVHVGVSRK